MPEGEDLAFIEEWQDIWHENGAIIEQELAIVTAGHGEERACLADQLIEARRQDGKEAL